jgi:hypothetical protein
MDNLKLYQCPRTGLHVQLRLADDANGTQPYETVSCPACMQIHFIDKASGKLVGRKRE